MTEEQAIRAMEILGRLYAEQIGMSNATVTVGKKGTEDEKVNH